MDKLLRMFDGDDVFVNRKGENKPIVITDPFMNILGDIQPGLLKATFGSPQLMENGLDQRFLFTFAQITEFPMRDKLTMDHDLEVSWQDVVKQIYNMDYNGWGLISFSNEADEIYTEYFNRLQRKKAEIEATTADGYLLSVCSKLQIQAQRLAGIVHLTNMINSPNSYNFRQITAAEMEYTTRCMDYFEYSAGKVYNIICDNIDTPRKKSNVDLIKDFNRQIPIINRADFARGIGKDLGYLSRVLGPNRTEKIDRKKPK